jgi:transposase
LDYPQIISSLEQQVVSLKEENAFLRNQLEVLLSKSSKNSHNSSKPPSSDSFVRHTKSLRKPSGKKAGGQPGHEGTTLKMAAVADEAIMHRVHSCAACGKDISLIGTQSYERRQVFDIPPVKVSVREHCCEIKSCPHCAAQTKAVFPEGVSQPVQYGKNIQQWAMYMMHYQLLPVERTAEAFQSLYNHSISTATLMNMSLQCYNQLEGFEQTVTEQLCKQDVVHFDETGYYVDNKRQWLHSASTAELTLYMPHAKGGKEAMDAMKILPVFKGNAMHDFWGSYMDYPCEHTLCNAHHLRDFTFCEEHEKSNWAMEMKTLLLRMKEAVDIAKQEGKPNLALEQITSFENDYDQLIIKGKAAHPARENQSAKRGKVKQSKTYNMLKRFDEHRKSILGFIWNFKIPFDNNLAERDIRMMKLKQKISGCFRSMTGAKIFARIRSYISTCKKQGLNILDALSLAIHKNPFIPSVYPDFKDG